MSCLRHDVSQGAVQAEPAPHCTAFRAEGEAGRRVPADEGATYLVAQRARYTTRPRERRAPAPEGACGLASCAKPGTSCNALCCWLGPGKQAVLRGSFLMHRAIIVLLPLCLVPGSVIVLSIYLSIYLSISLSVGWVATQIPPDVSRDERSPPAFSASTGGVERQRRSRRGQQGPIIIMMIIIQILILIIIIMIMKITICVCMYVYIYIYIISTLD